MRRLSLSILTPQLPLGDPLGDIGSIAGEIPAQNRPCFGSCASRNSRNICADTNYTSSRNHPSMPISLVILIHALRSFVRSRSELQLENLALRHQINVLRRAVKKRPPLKTGDRFFWVSLSRIWRGWRAALVIVKPETVVGWHRTGFRLFWTWKVRHGQPGRPIVPYEVRDLIRRMCRENPIWGAPRIHGELLKLGIDIGETSVSKYMVHCR